jgi:hypothetical protein
MYFDMYCNIYQNTLVFNFWLLPAQKFKILPTFELLIKNGNIIENQKHEYDCTALIWAISRKI